MDVLKFPYPSSLGLSIYCLSSVYLSVCLPTCLAVWLSVWFIQSNLNLSWFQSYILISSNLTSVSTFESRFKHLLNTSPLVLKITPTELCPWGFCVLLMPPWHIRQRRRTVVIDVIGILDDDWNMFLFFDFKGGSPKPRASILSH